MKYSELISFKPIESTIQLLETADKKVAQDMVQTYVMSDNMAESIKATVIDQLQMEEVVDKGDVAKLREKKLWKEFEGYLASKGKLKLFRSEAIRVGFARLWKDKNYQAIVDMAERLPEQTVQEDPNILMYYDISLSRV
jgi:hypothetical protein